MLQPSFLKLIFIRIYFKKSDFRQGRELPFVAKFIVLILNQSPGSIQLAQNSPVLRGRGACDKGVVPLFLLSPYRTCSIVNAELFQQYFGHYCDHSVIRI